MLVSGDRRDIFSLDSIDPTDSSLGLRSRFLIYAGSYNFSTRLLNILIISRKLTGIFKNSCLNDNPCSVCCFVWILSMVSYSK
jgi:hypothetical protein